MKEAYYRIVGISLAYLTVSVLTGVMALVTGLSVGVGASSRFALYQELQRVSVSLSGTIGESEYSWAVNAMLQPLENIVYKAAFFAYQNEAITANIGLFEGGVWVLGIVSIFTMATGIVMAISGELPSPRNFQKAVDVLGGWG